MSMQWRHVAMDQKGHRGQVEYHMARMGSVDTEQFDITGMREHLKALDAPQELIDYVVEHARDDAKDWHDGSDYTGWGHSDARHQARVRSFLYPEN